MNDHATLLREAATAVRPMIEDDIDKREIYAAWRKKFSDAGLDWMAFKSLQKARVEDDRDESGDGKRVAKIMDRLDCTAAYAEMLGYGSAKMNENNCFSASYSEAKGRGFFAGLTDEQKAAALAYDGEDSPIGELTDKHEHASDCAVHNEPAFPAGVCDCGAESGTSEVVRRMDATTPPAGTSTGVGIAVSPASDKSEQDEVDGDARKDPASVASSTHSNQREVMSHAEAGSAGDEASRSSAPAINSEMDRATEGSLETGSEAAENARKAIPASPEDGSVSHAGAGEIPATYSNSVASSSRRPDTAGGVISSAPPANLSDPYDPGDIPAFLKRDGGYPKREVETA